MFINKCPIKCTGKYRDTIFKDGKIIDIQEGENLIVTGFFSLVNSLLINGNNGQGIKYWAVGSGSNSWLASDLPKPSPSDTQLLQEIGRKVITKNNIYFCDLAGNKSNTPTNSLYITVTFEADDCNGDWREFGIFGGTDATQSINTGIMIDRKIHGKIEKTPELEIKREIIITLINSKEE